MTTQHLTAPGPGPAMVISQHDYETLVDTLAAQRDAIDALLAAHAPPPPVVVVDWSEAGRRAQHATRRAPGYIIAALVGSTGALLLVRLDSLALALLFIAAVVVLVRVLR